MFAARQLSPTEWGLSLRRKNLIATANGVPIRFATQKQAKACVDEMNPHFPSWEQDPHSRQTFAVLKSILEKHHGLHPVEP